MSNYINKKKRELDFEEINNIIYYTVASVIKRKSPNFEDLCQDAWVKFLTLDDDKDLFLIIHIIKQYIIDRLRSGVYNEIF